MKATGRDAKVVVLVVALALVLLVPSTASAAFTRPFLREISGTCPFPGPCAPGEAIPIGGGLTTDAEDNLWVGAETPGHPGKPPFAFGQFAPAYFPGENAFFQTLEFEDPEANVTQLKSIAINRSTGHFYLTGNGYYNIKEPGTVYRGGFLEEFDRAGTFIKQLGSFESPVTIAVDNSAEPTAGSVYVAHGNDPSTPYGDGKPQGIQKFSSALAEVPFSATAPYIEGSEIIGTPPAAAGGCEGLGEHNLLTGPEALAVDSQGDIYVMENNCTFADPHSLPTTHHVVLEYRPGGEFIRRIGGAETPGLGESHEYGGFGGTLNGIAVDPVSNHLLVSLSQRDTSNKVVFGAVDEFDSSGHYLNQITKTVEGASLHDPSQMTADSHGDLYVVDQSGSGLVDVYGPGTFLPSLRLAAPSERTPTTAVLNGSVDPDGRGLTDCRFEWVSEAAFQTSGFANLSSGGEGACIPAAASVPATNEYTPVHSEATGLSAGVTYRYRLLATTDEAALGGPAASGNAVFTAPGKPRIESTTADNLSSTFVDLRAQIAPLGADTGYRFEYVTQRQYERNGFFEPLSTPEVDVGSGGSAGDAVIPVLQHVGGLVPATAYRFRVLATNSVGQAEGSEVTFDTLPSAVPGLPDSRAYELLTPPAKGGASDMFGHGFRGLGDEGETRDVGVSSESGDAFLLETEAAFGSFPGSFGDAYVFSRGSQVLGPAHVQWTYASLTEPALGGVQNVGYETLTAHNVFFDPSGFSRVAFMDEVGSRQSESGQRWTNVVGSPGGPYTVLHADQPNFTEVGFEQTAVVGASRDVSHVVVQSRDKNLCAGAATLDVGSHLLCEYSEGEPMLVNVNSKGALLNRCGAVLGQDGIAEGGAHGAVSADGSDVIFTAPDPEATNDGPTCWNGALLNTPQLYMRSGEETLHLSAPEPTVKEGGKAPVQRPAAYLGASADGSRVFFLSEGWLTADHPEEAEPEKGRDPELYEWRSAGTVSSGVSCSESAPGYNSVSHGCLTRISVPQPAGGEAHVFDVKAIAAGGSVLYFSAFAALVPGAEPLQPSSQGPVNLYRYDALGGQTTFVATPLAGEALTGFFNMGWVGVAFNGATSLVAPTPAASFYATPDGRYLLFATTRELTGYRTLSSTCPTFPITQGKGNKHCQELYRYDAQAPLSSGQPGIPDNPVCVSCNPSGASPVSHARFTRSAQSFSNNAGSLRALSDDGSYAFFDTADALVPQDTNGTLDTYEWQAQGVSGCVRLQGCVRLLSSGSDAHPSFYLGSSADGSNVFFGTHASLVPADKDINGDLYDARVCTASDPCIQPAAGGTALCEGDACQNPSPAPIDATPGSLTFSGAGNLVSQPAPAVGPKGRTAARIRAEKRAKALKACKREPKRKRAACETRARKKYAPAKKKGKR